ncbi:hypothetical protein LPST10_00030 [Salmonella phage LPST10]|uniref:Uncharacterized protein n=5 Tax=Caudoviricetes TaxID=2731619 RepID=A0A1W6DYC6_9CAUD|nr:lipoprotein [Salmonella phage Segz_1]YP_010053724.1 lipoprotein [Salmonella virus VSt472]YP_010053795.1 lipoprotein [Salmonella phage LPST10]YP_010053875.1 lipoprotein [Salmonella phage VB_StyS_BS5]EIN1803799.1 hypothetical protein [Salmonella enterica]ARK07762.1 hypothetical protein LPST10_00030 [Salmonella phage LPST10]AXQ70358.1 hypothetical protein vst472_41 [Salmonella virus VSt472]QAX98683.1 putative lipoprotein [Salmonella phage Segz_1]QHB48539.1 protein membrane protein [Salmonel
MFGADIAIMIMYVLGFACTGMVAFLVFIPAMLMSVYIGWVIVDSFPAEYMYYLAQSMVWLIPAFVMRKSVKLALCSLTMCIYEWLVAVESFIWQFITPVETPLHSQYAFIIIGIHLFILSTTAKWGGEIGYTTWRNRHRIFASSDL